MSEAESANNGVYFLSLELENVRCFGKKQKLDLSDGKGNPARWTVILGDNGTGKTTLLQVLAKLKLSANIKLGEELKKVGTQQFKVTPTFAIGTDFTLTNKSKAAFCHYETTDTGSWFEWNEAAVELIDWTDGSIIKWIDGSEIKSSNFNCIAYGATRYLNKSSLYTKENTDATASLFDAKAELIDAEEWILRKDYAASKESPIQKKSKQQLELIKEILINLLPDVTDIKISVPSEVEPNPTVWFKTSFGWGRLRALSLGYQTMIVWIVDLAACLFERYPDSPNPIAEPAVVLIDEIDLHLHPKWQREIMRYLSERFTNTQFIVTAHSPLIVQAAEDENANIVVLRREGDEVIIDQQPKAIHGWRVDQLLASDLFGLKGSRSPKSEERLKERDEILNKPELTETDKKRLEELRYIPMAESPEDIEAMSIIREAAKLLKEKYK